LIVIPALLSGLEGVRSAPSRFAGTLVISAGAFPRTAPVPRVDDDRLVIGDDNYVTEAVAHVRETLGRGGTLARSLARLGLPPQQRHDAARALSRELDLARLSPSTGLCAGIDEDGRVVSVAVRSEAGRFVRWSRPRGEARVHVVDLPVRTVIESGGGRVAHSVRQALDGLPWADEVTLAVADVFQWDIDLLVDPRTGDRVRVVYEVQVLDRVPADTPRFGRFADTPGQPLRPGRLLAASYDGLVASSSAYWVEQEDGAGGRYYDADGDPLHKTFLKSPLNYRRISSRFSNARRNPVTRRVVPHHGVDFAAAPGTPVVAAADGRVVSTGWQGALGRAVRIRHGSEYTTVYGHLRGFATGIRAGTEVRQNQVIGYVGSSGRATGPHLHYTLVHRGRPIDPMRFRNPPVEPLAPELMPQLERAKLTWASLLKWDPVTVAGADLSTEVAALRRGI
jgi:murein DD-endopeptidase MepM/ murein hydrolase activator NlpD